MFCMETKVFCGERKRNYSQFIDDLDYVPNLLKTRGLHTHFHQKWLKAFEKFVLIPYEALRFISFYAEKPATFNPKDFVFAYTYDKWYLQKLLEHSSAPSIGRRVSISSEKYCRLNADAPFVYILELKNNDNAIVPGVPILCVLSFNFDLNNKILFIEQIQGGDTWYYYKEDLPQHVKLSKRARFKFKYALPEIFVYDAIENLAANLNLKHIAIRRPQFNRWHNVIKRAAFNPGSTLYDKVSKNAGFALANNKLQSRLLSINTEVYFWKSIK